MPFSDCIIEKNHQFCIVDKPATLPSCKDKSGDLSLQEMTEKYMKQSLYLVHRLDRPVYGLLLFAKSPQAAANLSSQFKNKTIKKYYLAIIEGKFDEKSGIFKDTLELKKRRGNKSKIKTEEENDPNAITHFEILGSLDRYSLVMLIPETGKIHQLRAQVAHHLSPIKGDVKYGARRKNEDRSIDLFSWKIEFHHPVTNEQLAYTAPFPGATIWQACLPIIDKHFNSKNNE